MQVLEKRRHIIYYKELNFQTVALVINLVYTLHSSVISTFCEVIQWNITGTNRWVNVCINVFLIASQTRSQITLIDSYILGNGNQWYSFVNTNLSYTGLFKNSARQNIFKKKKLSNLKFRMKTLKDAFKNWLNFRIDLLPPSIPIFRIFNLF